MQVRNKLIPVVVALPLFMQNMDTSVLATALPAISESLHVDALQLNLAITAYLISLAIFLPASGWLADKFGPRRLFCWAIAVFMVGSISCAASNSLETLVAARVLQGMGGSMMVPVGRLILLRGVRPADMVTAMVWFTIPPALGRVVGPAVGGAIVTWLSWRWIFLLTIPVSLSAIALAFSFIDVDGPPEDAVDFDLIGFLFLGLGLASILGAMQSAGSRLVAPHITAAFASVGVLGLAGYYVHSRSVRSPLIDLGIVRYPTFFAAAVAAIPLRLAIGASPFMMPLMFQLGFHMSALDSGLLTIGTAVGSLATRVIIGPSIRAFGFKPLLLGATASTSVCYMAYGLFTGTTPHALIFAVLMAGGLINALVMVSLQTLAYSEIPKPLMGHSTAFAVMVQQLANTLGVLMAAELLRLAVWRRGGSADHLVAGDFGLAFFVVSAVVMLCLPSFMRLPRDVGATMR